MADLRRRDFLIRFCQGAGAAFIPARYWRAVPGSAGLAVSVPSFSEEQARLHARYRNSRPIESALAKVASGLDEFALEKYVDRIAAVLQEWRAGLLRSPRATDSVERSLDESFSGTSFQPVESRILRSDRGLQARRNRFAGPAPLDRQKFLRDFEARLSGWSKVVTAEFQITRVDTLDPSLSDSPPKSLRTRVRYEIVGAGDGFFREQRVGEWDLLWIASASSGFLVREWHIREESEARSLTPVYVDITASALGGNSSYQAQLQHGVDYWRTVLDGASGIDIYGHNGVCLADIDNDGYDDLYVCQPAGLPNRLYRNRGDGTFEDITESSELGILENTACALFADFNNDGLQDVIVVRANGPLLFLNEGGGRFRQRKGAFQFANPPQGTFTGAAVADYDCDGWLDIYFCLYSFYQGTGQYRYPVPYHDAENGPPNFLMRNQRDGTFRDVTAQAGLNQNNTRYSFCCAWGDYNRDGWPDLYVVNDFGRKNLYRNQGDGTFTDVAAQVGVEDVGAGMSVSWLDRDNGGAEDVYVGNMWTAAGVRVSMQDVFKKDSSVAVRALYQQHAMGNFLFHNKAGIGFEDTTIASGVGVGRWAWSSDALDFDHDGFPDLYVANGMVSGPAGSDLNSFFWRQVVAQSPDDARSVREYEQGWDAINELIRADNTWSGYERNVFYANNRDGTFSDVSASIGLDFVEDGRSFAIGDFDHDGRQEIVLKSRNAPQLRVLKNVMAELPASIAFRLRGTKSNRDAIGAAVTVDTGSAHLTRRLQAGSAFLSQHSKDVFFGLGDATGPLRASIRWPSGLVQEFPDLPINHRVWVKEGSEELRIEPFRSIEKKWDAGESHSQPEVLPRKIETWLLDPVAAPDFSLADSYGKRLTLSSLRGRLVLLCLWTADYARANAKLVQDASTRWQAKGLRSVVVLFDAAAGGLGEFPGSNEMLQGSEEVAAVYNILFHQLFDRHRDLNLPTAFLIDAEGDIVKVYQGAINLDHVEYDFQHIPPTDGERMARGLPFPSTGFSLDYGRNYLSLGSLYFQRGYLDQAGSFFQRALRDDPSSAEAQYAVGSVYLDQNKNPEARTALERAVTLKANYPDTLPDAWNNLGVIATREGRAADSVPCFQEALRLNPHHLLALDNLGNAYRLQKRWDDARAVLERALNVAPEDPEANYSLGMVFAQANDVDKAYEYLRRALKARPAYPEALNNLGVLYMVTQRRDQAVASFEECIRVAPAFDQAYLNLARVYALEGSRDQARTLLNDLLKQHPAHALAKQMLEQLQ